MRVPSFGVPSYEVIGGGDDIAGMSSSSRGTRACDLLDRRFELCLLRRKNQNMASEIRERPAIPPTTPPAMAPA